MKPFRFRLQSLLEFREFQANEAAAEYERRQAEFRECEEELRRRRAAKEEAQMRADQWRDYADGLPPGPLSDYAHVQASDARELSDEAAREVEKSQKDLNTAQKARDQARIEHEYRLREQRQMEDLRDREKVEFRKEQELKEMTEASEIATSLRYLETQERSL